MKSRNTLIAIILMVLIGVYIIFFERHQETTEEKEAKKDRVFDLKSEDISRIEILRDGEEKPIALEKRGEEWNMTSPVSYKGDRGAVDSILSKLEFLEKKREITQREGALDLEEYGLKTPQMQVRFWRGESSHSLNVGKKTALEEKIYIQVDGRDAVLVVDDSLLDSLEKRPSELRDKAVMEMKRYKVNHLALMMPEQTLEIVREDDQWHSKKPVEDRCDETEVGKVLDALHSLKAESFFKDGPEEGDIKKTGLGSPFLTVTVGHEEKEAGKSTALFGKSEEGELYAMREGGNSILLLQKDVLKEIPKTIDRLREKRLAPIGYDPVEEITLAGREGEILLEKEKEDWKIKKPFEGEGDLERIDEFTDTLRDLEIEKYVDDSPESLVRYGLESPSFKVSLKLSGGRSEGFLVGKEAEEGTFACREGGKPIFALQKGALAFLDREALYFKNRKVLHFHDYDANSITLLRENLSFDLQKKEGKWKMEAPIKREADEDSVRDLLSSLSDLKADEWVALEAEDLESFGLSSPSIRAEVRVKTFEKGKEKEEKKVLLVGKEKEKGRFYAMVEGQKSVFLTKEDLVKRLKEELLPCRVWDFSESDVEKLEILRGKESFVLEKDENGDWAYESPMAFPADKSGLEDLLFSLSNLKGNAFVYQEKDLKDLELDSPGRVLKVMLKGGEEKVLKVGKKAGGEEYFALHDEESMPFLLGSHMVEKLDGDFYSKVLLKVDPKKVREVAFQGEEESWTLKSSGEEWKVEGREGERVKKDEMEDLLDLLSSLEGDSVASLDPEDLEPFGLKEPFLTITLLLEEGKRGVRIGRGEKGGFFGQAEGGKAVYKLGREKVEELTRSPGKLLEEKTEESKEKEEGS